MRRRRVVRVLATAVAVRWADSRPLHAQEPDPVLLARAYTAAWNAHDLAAVLALFAPDAVVRERRGDVPPAVWDARDPQVVRAYLEESHGGDVYETGGLVWAMGHRQIAAWATAAFAHHHRFAAGVYHAAGDTVSWPYREFVDPFQLVPGVGPAEGTASAVVRRGRITVLSLVQPPDTFRRLQRETDAFTARTSATQRAAPLGDGPRRALNGPPRGGPTADPADPAWPLALGGLAALGALIMALRWRRRP